MLSSGESFFIKIDSLKCVLSQGKIEKSLKLLLLCSCNNRWSDIAYDLHAILFPFKEDKPICSPDLTFEWRSVFP